MQLSKEYELKLRQGIDHEKYDVYRILPQKPNVAAVILRSKQPDPNNLWCVQYLGNGHYFNTYAQAIAYCKKRCWTQFANLKKQGGNTP